ncbi:hypothetical protein ACWIUD_03520 [Helicobacter sp. 23-1044]
MLRLAIARTRNDKAGVDSAISCRIAESRNDNLDSASHSAFCEIYEIRKMRHFASLNMTKLNQFCELYKNRRI